VICVRGWLTRLFFLSSLLLLLPTPTVTGWQEELGQLRSEREAVFERWRQVEESYKVIYEREFGEIEEGMGDVKTD
jgi:hypothetical protein